MRFVVLQHQALEQVGFVFPLDVVEAGMRGVAAPSTVVKQPFTQRRRPVKLLEATDVVEVNAGQKYGSRPAAISRTKARGCPVTGLSRQNA